MDMFGMEVHGIMQDLLWVHRVLKEHKVLRELRVFKDLRVPKVLLVPRDSKVYKVHKDL
jgi:hypothetical protein